MIHAGAAAINIASWRQRHPCRLGGGCVCILVIFLEALKPDFQKDVTIHAFFCQNRTMHNGTQTSVIEESKPPSQQALVDLCVGLLPVWARQLASSRAQSETAVGEMLKAFADIGPHIDMAERQSRQINDALTLPKEGVHGLVAVCEHLLLPLQGDLSLPRNVVAVIEKVLAMVRDTVGALEQVAKPFQHETQMVAKQVERMYIGFQYQDRINQMMALLESDIARLQQALTGQGQGQNERVTDLTSWLARLESEYAMAEQRNGHHGTQSVTTNTTNSLDDNEATFF